MTGCKRTGSSDFRLIVWTPAPAILMPAFVGPTSLTVGLYGTPTGRTIESTTAPLVAHGKVKVKKKVDPTLKPGEQIVDDPGEPALTTSVTRDVYAADGKLLHHDTWYSHYRAAPELLRVGPKKKRKAPTTPPLRG